MLMASSASRTATPRRVSAVVPWLAGLLWMSASCCLRSEPLSPWGVHTKSVSSDADNPFMTAKNWAKEGEPLGLSIAAADATAGLSVIEAEALHDAPDLPADVAMESLSRGRAAALAYLHAHSLTLCGAANRLEVEPAELRGQITRGVVVAFDLGDGLRIPTWQLYEDQLLPHLDAVLARLRESMSPLELARLMTVRRDSLDGETIPAWLGAGGDVARVLRIVEETWNR